MRPEFILYGIFFILPSSLFLLFPVNFLKLGSKLKYENAEPSDFAITVGYAASIIGILAGIALTVIELVC